MTPEQFCYWLQGYFELNEHGVEHTVLTPQQVQIIKDHLKLVFNKVTQTYPSLNSDYKWTQTPLDGTYTNCTPLVYGDGMQVVYDPDNPPASC